MARTTSASSRIAAAAAQSVAAVPAAAVSPAAPPPCAGRFAVSGALAPPAGAADVAAARVPPTTGNAAGADASALTLAELAAAALRACGGPVADAALEVAAPAVVGRWSAAAAAAAAFEPPPPPSTPSFAPTGRSGLRRLVGLATSAYDAAAAPGRGAGARGGRRDGGTDVAARGRRRARAERGYRRRRDGQALASEVLKGFPAMLLRFLAFFSTRMGPNEGGHRLYSILATQCVVEVAPVWVASLKVKGYLWHLSNAMFDGMCTLTPARLGDGRDGDYAELLEEMIILLNSLDWVSVQPFLRRTAAKGTDAATRGFVDCFFGLSKGKFLPRKGLGVDSYPYGPGIGAQSPPPASGRMVSGKRPALPKNTERRVTYPPPPKRSFGSHGCTNQAGPSRAGPPQVQAPAYVDLDAPAAATLPLPQFGHRAPSATAGAAVVTPLEPPASSELFPAANLRAEFFSGRSLPEQCTRGLLTMFPPVGADIWDASPVVAVIALAEVLARVSRRASSLAVHIHQAGQPALA